MAQFYQWLERESDSKVKIFTTHLQKHGHYIGLRYDEGKWTVTKGLFHPEKQSMFVPMKEKPDDVPQKVIKELIHTILKN